jgi:hypothetical protein
MICQVYDPYIVGTDRMTGVPTMMSEFGPPMV